MILGLLSLRCEGAKVFTGIITDIGVINEVHDRGDRQFIIQCHYAPETIALGASIACSGVCLTVTEVIPTKEGCLFSVDASGETLAVTTAQDWGQGTRLNLERALCLGDELGGHIVSGHVDGVGTIVDIAPEGASQRYTFEAPEKLAPFIAPKGSVTLDGTSLTVNAVDKCQFTVNIIPHTQEVTCWGQAAAGQRINLEIDVLARYVARLQEFQTL